MDNSQVNAGQNDNETSTETTKQQTENSEGKRRISGTTGTGIAAGETGYAESGQLPDPAAPPVAKAD